MNNTDIQKIRQLLKKVISKLCKDCNSDDCSTQRGCQYKDLFHEINQALALLPCETCGGSGRLAKYNQVGNLVVGDLCPDCQSPDDGYMDIETLKRMDDACGDNLSHGKSNP